MRIYFSCCFQKYCNKPWAKLNNKSIFLVAFVGCFLKYLHYNHLLVLHKVVMYFGLNHGVEDEEILCTKGSLYRR